MDTHSIETVAPTITVKTKKGIPDFLKKPKDTDPWVIPDAFNIPDALLAPEEKAMRDWWRKFIIERKQAKYLLTVAFKVHCTNEQGLEAASFFVRKIGRNLFNHDHGTYPTAGLTGVCLLEPHMLRHGFHGQCHFHMLIDDNAKIANAATFKRIALKEMKKVVTLDNWPMLDENVVDVRAIWDIEGLADYLTKTLRMHRWKANGDNFCIVESNGLRGMCGARNERNY